MHKAHISTVAPKTSWLKPPVSTGMKSGYVILHRGDEVGEHVTDNREEVLYIIEGEAKVTVGDMAEYAEAGSMIYIPPQTKHNVANESEEDVKYVYVTASFK